MPIGSGYCSRAMAVEECKHGMEASWCSYCKADSAVMPSRSPRRKGEAPIRSRKPEHPWTIRKSLFEWQRKAINAWGSNGNWGVIVAATGTGKTTAACAAIERLHTQHGDQLRVAVIVPTKILARQWRDALQKDLDLDPRWFSGMYSNADSPADPKRPVLVAVLDSARTKLRPFLTEWAKQGGRTLLIVDECHRAGSRENAKIFKSLFHAALGLSATPERPDRGHEEFVYPNIGRPVYTYALRQALDDGVLAAPTSLNLYVDFTADEQDRWDISSRALAEAFAALQEEHPYIDLTTQQAFKTIEELAQEGDPAGKQVFGSILARRDLLSECSARRRCVDEIFAWMARDKRKALVFHETIRAAEESHERLRGREVVTVIDHSGMPEPDRKASADAFKRDETQVMVAVRSLDEGVDVPEAEVAVIVAGSRTARQRIQRIGRVVRQRPNKSAVVISILTRGTPEESITGVGDADLLGAQRVRHYCWPRTSLADALDGAPSSYVPNRSPTAIDVLTLEVLSAAIKSAE